MLQPQAWTCWRCITCLRMLFAFPMSHVSPRWAQSFQGLVLGHSLAPMGQMIDLEPLSNVILGSRCYSLRWYDCK